MSYLAVINKITRHVRTVDTCVAAAKISLACISPYEDVEMVPVSQSTFVKYSNGEEIYL